MPRRGSAAASPPQESENGRNHLRDFYRAAVLELDRSLLKIRLKAAEDAINARTSDARASREERREMADALSTLRRLQKVDW
jgi:hypothetical protein